MTNQTDVLVIGGGASGLIAAGFAAKAGATVVVAEKKDRPARKILVTGKGRCNVTNNCDPDTFISMVQTNPYFMYSSYYGFTAQDTMALFESVGVPLMTERGQRVFPQSEKAMDIADGLVAFATQNGAVITQAEIQSLLLEEDRVVGARTNDGKTLLAKTVIVATGGLSYPGTGSTGDGYDFARQAGHEVTSLRGSLLPIDTSDAWVPDLQGLSLRNVELSLYKKDSSKVLWKDLGEMLFAHFGISGPLVLSASAHMKERPSQYRLAVNLKPALTREQLDQRVQRDFQQYNNRDFGNALDDLLPRKLIPVIMDLAGISPTKKVHQVTGEERGRLVDLLQHLPLTPCALRPHTQAVVTAGGVDVDGVDPYTMASLCTSGLYFAGEVLDVDAYTGGFNLQIAFSTGHAAGVAAAAAAKEGQK